MIIYIISQIWYLIYKEPIFQFEWREFSIRIQHCNPAARLLGLLVQNCSRLALNLYFYNFKKPAFQDLGMTNTDRHQSGSRRKISSFLYFEVQKIILHCIRCSFHHCTVDVTISGRGRRSDEFYWPVGHLNLLTCRCHAHAWCFMTKYHSILPFWV